MVKQTKVKVNSAALLQAFIIMTKYQIKPFYRQTGVRLECVDERPLGGSFDWQTSLLCSLHAQTHDKPLKLNYLPIQSAD